MMWNGCTNKPLTGVIFDKDGTLLEVEQFWCAVYQYAISVFLEIDAEQRIKIYENIGINENGLVRNSLAVMGSVKEIWMALKAAIEAPIKSLEIFEALVKEGVHRYISLVSFMSPSVPTFLDTLKNQGIYIALITTDSRANTEYMLKTFEIFHHFDYIGCSDDKLSPKPAIDHGLAFVDKYQLLTHEMLMVGDSIYDAMFAERLNMGFAEIRNAEDFEALKNKKRALIC
ncbi:MAG: HAD family hydrolase [Clostridia bacterium]|nr:HAD family hydrolase [Clostridia bacterium]